MLVRGKRQRFLVATMLLVPAVLVSWHLWNRAQSGAAVTPQPPGATESPPAHLPPPAKLRLLVSESSETQDSLLDPAYAIWKKAMPTVLLLSRTPRIYQTEPVEVRSVPACELRAIRTDGQLYVRLQWDDLTKNAPEAPPAKSGEGGDSKQLYKRPTAATAIFPDAAAVMVPEHWTGPSFPSLLMGDKANPALLYYWNASRGAEVLTATGRATPQPSGLAIPHRSQHADDQWVLTMAMPDRPDGYPMAFALWDGQHNDRDGLKFFSVWYVLGRDN